MDDLGVAWLEVALEGFVDGRLPSFTGEMVPEVKSEKLDSVTRPSGTWKATLGPASWSNTARKMERIEGKELFDVMQRRKPNLSFEFCALIPTDAWYLGI